MALFERDRRAVSLTEAGAALLPLAQEVLETWRDAELAVAERAATAAAVLRVGFLTRVGRGLLPAVQAALRRVAPRLAAAAAPRGLAGPDRRARRRQQRRRDRLAAAARRHARSRSSWSRRSRAGSRWPPGTRSRPATPIDFAELLDEAFLALPAAAGVARDFWLAVEDRGGRPVRVAAEVASADETFEALLTERAVVLLASGNADLYDRPGIVARPVTGIGPARLAVAWRADDGRATVREFVEACRRLSDDAQGGAVAS